MVVLYNNNMFKSILKGWKEQLTFYIVAIRPYYLFDIHMYCLHSVYRN